MDLVWIGIYSIDRCKVISKCYDEAESVDEKPKLKMRVIDRHG